MSDVVEFMIGMYVCCTALKFLCFFMSIMLIQMSNNVFFSNISNFSFLMSVVFES